jgi:hypothetical protein
MSQAKDQAVVYVTNWMMQHKDDVAVREKIDALKVMDVETRINDDRFSELVVQIKYTFGNGNMIQRNMFGFIERDEFNRVVSDRIGEFDDIVEMSKNFTELLGNRRFRTL